MDIKTKINKLPDASGVYFFKNKENKIIYVGKANSLKSRVSSYFRNFSQNSNKICKMVIEIADVEYIVTNSEVEALILESKMIKKNNPYYNAQSKDDKSYPYIKITKEEFPQIFFNRKVNYDKKINKANYYGPFTDADATRKVVKSIRQIFKIRGCRQKKFRGTKACLDYQIDLCSAPCINKISKMEYQKRIKEICLFLSGKHKKLLRELYQEMQEDSDNLNYEKAARIRDKIKSIEKIIIGQKANYHIKKQESNYSFKKIEETEEIERKKGKKAIIDLKEKLKLDTIPYSIEAFDISNIQGQLAVGSMVVFENGRPKNNDYRRFKVREINRIDDYAMLQEIVERRYKKLLSENKKLPDLILIDGGKGQLSAVNKILNELNINLPVISLAKKEEEIFKIESVEPIILQDNSEALFLLQRIRDEAHRFAIAYHRKIRSKELRNSKIDVIPGIGKKRKNKLLEHFKSIEEIQNASIDEISKVPGIGKKIAKTIQTILEVRR